MKKLKPIRQDNVDICGFPKLAMWLGILRDSGVIHMIKLNHRSFPVRDNNNANASKRFLFDEPMKNQIFRK